jgi:hypothetical protein
MSRLLLQTTLKRSASAATTNTARRSIASSENLRKTSLHQWHLDLGGDMVPFAGYELPVLYKGDNAPNGGVMKEHLWCRSEGKASLFDVSHMGQVRSFFVFVVIIIVVVVVVCKCFVSLCKHETSSKMQEPHHTHRSSVIFFVFKDNSRFEHRHASMLLLFRSDGTEPIAQSSSKRSWSVTSRDSATDRDC